MANQISVNTGSGAGAQQVIVDSNGNITVTVSRSVIGTVANVASANYANFAGEVVDPSQPNITSVGNLTNLSVTGTTTTGNLVVLGNLQVGNLVANTANYANFAGNAFAVDGANVNGAVANANIANVAYSVDVANVSGIGNIATINLDGNIANALLGDGTFGPVELDTANYANFAGNAFAVDGANVNGAVANATFANDAANANIANVAYSVDVANVNGIGNIATINLDGNVANALLGDGSFGPVELTTANYANFAGTVLTNAQPNITSVGNLSSLTVTGNLTGNAITWSNLITYTGNTAASDKILVQADLPGAVSVRNLGIRAGNVSNALASNTSAGGLSFNGGLATSSDTGNVFIARAGPTTISSGIASTANGAAFSGNFTLGVGTAFSNSANATSGTVAFAAGSAVAANGNAIISTTGSIGGGLATATNGNAFGGTFSYLAANANATSNGTATGGNINITSGSGRSANGNSSSGNINITTGFANSNVTAGTGTVGSININTGTANGITGNVLGNINIGNSGSATAINIGAAGTPANVAGNLNVVGNANANIVNAAYLYGDGSNLSNINGANVSGTVANATFALDAGNANIANIAYSVDVANVAGIGNIATINLDGNVSNALLGDGTFGSPANANYANFAGDVVNSAQPNITSTGNLVSLTINNGIGNTVTSQFEPNIITVPTTFQFPQAVSVIKTSGIPGTLNQVPSFYLIKDRPGNAAANSNDFIVRNAFGAVNSGGNVNISNDFFNQVRGTPGVGNAWVPGSYSWRNGLTNGNLTPNNTFTTGFISMNQAGTFAVSAGAPGSSGITLATFGTQNGAISNTAPANAFVITRGRGNGDSRLTVEPNDYLGDIIWNGQVANGFTGGQSAKLRAKIDNSYVSNTRDMPVGIELVTIGSSNTINTHNFYANGNVAFTNSVSAGNGNVTLNTDGTISYLRTFGNFTSNATQTSNGANTVNFMTFNNDEGSNGVSIVSSSQLTVARPGIYNIQFSAELIHDVNQTANIEIWLTKNGTAVANSAGRVLLTKDEAQIASWNYVDNAATANTYYQLAWASPDTSVQLLAVDSANTISGVAIPSVIATVVPVGA